MCRGSRCEQEEGVEWGVGWSRMGRIFVQRVGCTSMYRESGSCLDLGPGGLPGVVCTSGGLDVEEYKTGLANHNPPPHTHTHRIA